MREGKINTQAALHPAELIHYHTTVYHSSRNRLTVPKTSPSGSDWFKFAFKFALPNTHTCTQTHTWQPFSSNSSTNNTPPRNHFLTALFSNFPCLFPSIVFFCSILAETSFLSLNYPFFRSLPLFFVVVCFVSYSVCFSASACDLVLISEIATKPANQRTPECHPHQHTLPRKLACLGKIVYAFCFIILFMFSLASCFMIFRLLLSFCIWSQVWITNAAHPP